MFTCPPIPESKRPELKQSKSTAWSWPRLVTVQDQRTQSTSSAKHSAAPSLHKQRQKERAPDAVEEQVAPRDSTLSPINSTAGSAHPTESSDTGCTIDRHSRVSSVTDSEDEPPECVDECEEDMIHNERMDTKHQSERDDKIPNVSEKLDKDKDKKPGSAEHRKAGSSSSSSASSGSSSSSESKSEQRFPKMISAPAQSTEQNSNPVSASDERTPSVAQGPANSPKQGSLSSNDDGKPSVAQGPAKPFEQNGKTVPEEGAPGSKVRPVYENNSIPGEVSRPGVPKIKVQEPSEASVANGASLEDPARPRTIDNILAEQHQMSLQQEGQHISDMIPSQQATNMVSLPPVPTDLSGLKIPTAPKAKKRQLAIRKARNIAARKIILKAVLGRTLAVPTKQALKRLANGEVVTVEDLPVCT